jgi:hypothetical protein
VVLLFTSGNDDAVVNGAAVIELFVMDIAGVFKLIRLWMFITIGNIDSRR